VHFVGEPGAAPWVYDQSDERFAREIQTRHRGDARPAVEDYFRRVRAMVDEARDWKVPVVVGHLDRIALWNRADQYFSTSSDWYGQAVADTLATIASSPCIVELNTSGWNKLAAVPNPSPGILKGIADAKIPVIVSADAHWPANVAQHFDRGTALLRAAGFESIVVPAPRGWSRAPLPEPTD